jgi:hypothetical protein
MNKAQDGRPSTKKVIKKSSFYICTMAETIDICIPLLLFITSAYDVLIHSLSLSLSLIYIQKIELFILLVYYPWPRQGSTLD